jgi:hypothetical protein
LRSPDPFASPPAERTNRSVLGLPAGRPPWRDAWREVGDHETRRGAHESECRGFEAVLASAALPAIFPAAERDANGCIDGEVVDNTE